MQKKYGGDLVCSWRDSQGLIEVVDAYGVRSLHFGTPPRQSAMCLREPDRVELSYVRAMLTVLAFRPDPMRVLVIGLGGGALVKALFQACPQCEIEVVEYREQVLEVACQYFYLPQDRRIQMTIGDGRLVVAEKPLESLYDLILIDAFSADGMAEFAEAEVFYQQCAQLLKPGGVFAINLWGTKMSAFRSAMQWIQAAFVAGALRLPVTGKGNVIGIGLGQGYKRPGMQALQTNARRYQALLGLEMPYFLEAALRSNPRLVFA